MYIKGLFSFLKEYYLIMVCELILEKIMKNIFAGVFFLLALTSCSKQEFNDTKDTIKRADSLFTKANDGLKTLDSISKRVNDSDGIARKVLIPQIEKQTKKIDSTLKSGSWKIDSLNKDIAEITKHVKTGTDVAKTLDSASQLLQNGENAISVLSKTADKILKRTKSQKATLPAPSENSDIKNNPNNTVVIPPQIVENPLIKSAFLEIQVAELSDAKALLNQKIRENNADLVSENFSQNEGIQREKIRMKVPLQNFNQLVRDLSSELGDVKIKSTESEGTDYNSNQLCTIEVTLVQNEKIAGDTFESTETGKDPESFGAKSSNAFKSGFKVLETISLALLPFWPVFIIIGLIFYFVRRNKKNKEAKSLEIPTNHPVQKTETAAPAQTVEEKNTNDPEEPDYSKYLPKN